MRSSGHNASQVPAAALRGGLTQIILMSIVEGMLLALMLFSVMHARWEDRLVDRIVAIADATDANSSDSERAVSIMGVVHRALQPRLELFGPGGAIRPGPFLSTDSQIQVPAGYCGSFAHVLTRALRRAGIEAKLAQMKVGDVWGGHIVVAALVEGRWVALDPLYDVGFRGADGKLLGFEDIGARWDALREQCPPGYNESYRYEDVRFTNWSRVPLGETLMGGSGLSLRSYFLNLYWWHAGLAGSAAAVVGIVLVRRLRGFLRISSTAQVS